MPRLVFIISIFAFLFFGRCTPPIDTEFVVFAFDFQNTTIKDLFLDGVHHAADSLDLESTLVNYNTDMPTRQLDSLFKNCTGIALSAPVTNPDILTYVEKASKKQTPIVQFNHPEKMSESTIYIDSDAYTAGRAAARFIIEQYGEQGRFGILIPTLEDKEATESIRGFRQVLSPAQWKQVNIITCGDGFEQALKQYRYATRFGNRIIWFVANDCSDFLHELENLKKDNFFIAIDLHAKKNSIKFLQDGLLDAVVTKNFTNMGKLCLVELASARDNVNSEARWINCGSTVLTPGVFATTDE